MEETYLGRMIRQAREREGLTQRNLADAIDREQGYVSKIEHGATVPDWILERWAPILRVKLRSLILARSGIEDERVEGDRRELAVRFAGIMPADQVRWCEMKEREETVLVWEEFLGGRAAEDCFVVTVSGNCLAAAPYLIGDGYKVLLRDRRESERPRNGDIVAVRIDDEFSLKVWSQEGDTITLRDGEKRAVYEIDIAEASRLTVLGIYVTHWPS